MSKARELLNVASIQEEQTPADAGVSAAKQDANADKIVHSYMRALPYERKPSSFAEVSDVITDPLPPALKQAMMNTDAVGVAVLNHEDATSNSEWKKWQYWVVSTVAGEHYLVNTEGYDYPRYVVGAEDKLADDLEEVMDAREKDLVRM